MQVLAVGNCTLDQIGVVERFAENGAHVEMPTFSIQGGGTAATAAVAMSRWGASTRIIGKVADDERGDLIERTLSSEGVETSHLVRDIGKVSQLTFIIIEAPTRRCQSYFTRGNVDPLKPQDIQTNVVDGHELLVVDGLYPQAQIELMKRAKTLNIPVVLEGRRGRGGAAECVAYSDVIVASEREASALTGVGSLEGICRAFLKKGPKIAVVTLGDEGAVAMDERQELIRVEALNVEVVDRTGAGDIFLGAVGLGVLEGWPLEKIVRYANAAASLSCGGLGGRSTIVDRATLEEMI